MTAPSPRQLTAAFSRLSEASAAALLATSHGIAAAHIERLATERDDSFCVDTERGSLVAKFAHPLDDPRSLLDQVTVLETLWHDHADLPVQRVLPGLDGELVHRVIDDAGQARSVRVLSYLDGELLGARTRSLADLHALGSFHARFASAVASIGDADPTLTGSETAWNLTQFELYAPRADDLADGPLRNDVLRVLDGARRTVLPRLDTLPAVLAHNDLHGDNVLVSAEPFAVTGVLDFGDMTRTPRVADLAVAASYARGRAPSTVEPWGAAKAYVAGFAAVQPLTDDERALLPELVLLRLAQRGILNSAIAAANPAAADYASRNLSAIARDLRELSASIPSTIGAPA
ncbi:phosphotransferase [Microcella sp.]|uniref:phosphotransferase n=1 Tax=Microcella sp. TaxID=1913979 RepID=UPI0025692EF6|nr:phosphotransferase [Microcella sp.]MBX9471822.1 phosphotransferase [Microcella sp.]